MAKAVNYLGILRMRKVYWSRSRNGEQALREDATSDQHGRERKGCDGKYWHLQAVQGLSMISLSLTTSRSPAIAQYHQNNSEDAMGSPVLI